MIDKNGRIGGKVNVIDLIILIVIAAVIAFVGYRFIGKDRSGLIKSDPVRMEFVATTVPNYAAERIREGAQVYDVQENTYLGTITDIEFGKAYEFVPNEEGKTVMLEPTDSVSATITTLVNGSLDGNGVVIDGTRYAAGHSMVLYAGDAKVWVRVSGTDPA